MNPDSLAPKLRCSASGSGGPPGQCSAAVTLTSRIVAVGFCLSAGV